jgi:signal transduction histidine kinase
MRGPVRGLSRGEWAVALAVGCLCQWAVWAVGPAYPVTPRWVLAVASAAACALLVWRQRRPLAVVVGATLVLVVLPAVFWGAAETVALVFPLIVALFAAGRYGGRPTAYVAAPVVVAAVLVHEWLDPYQSVADGWTWALNSVWIFGLGAWLQQQGRLTERATALTAERERAAAAEARADLARELHDVLAHSVSVMVVQAEAAGELFDRDPASARSAVGAVAQVGRAALTDTRRLVGSLRGADADPGPGPTAADLPGLVDQFTAAGLPLDSHVQVDGPLPEPVGRTVYRVVQEALTNVLRHAGPVPTRLHVRVGPADVEVEVENDGPLATVADGGHGLLGMAERVNALDGSLDAGPGRGGGFAVRAHIPLP